MMRSKLSALAKAAVASASAIALALAPAAGAGTGAGTTVGSWRLVHSLSISANHLESDVLSVAASSQRLIARHIRNNQVVWLQR